MNRTYRSVWNEALGAWVATSEASTGRGKKSRGGRVALALALTALAPAAFAQAVGGGVASGMGSTAISPTTACETWETPAAAQAVASGHNAIAIGCSADAVLKESISIGLHAGEGAVLTDVNGGAYVGNIALGSAAGQTVAGSNNIGVGANAGSNVTGSRNTAVGFNAGTNVDGRDNVAIGTDAGSSMTGYSTVSIGDQAGLNASGGSNIMVGQWRGTGWPAMPMPSSG